MAVDDRRGMRRLSFALFVVATLACKKSEPTESADAGLTTRPTPAAPSATAAAAPPSNLNACDTNKSFRCFDSKYALLCQNGHNEIIPCKGVGGCKNGSPDAVCDDKIAADGDPCRQDGSSADSNHACSPERHEELACVGNKFQPWRPCRGPAGCNAYAAKITCDTTLAEPNDVCTETGALACNRLDREMLECRNGHYAIASACRGTRGCSPSPLLGGKPVCDDSVANVSDPCEPADELRCSVDKHAELKCVGGHYAKKADCPKKGCNPGAPGKDPTCE
jgi:hypothetical protein